MRVVVNEDKQGVGVLLDFLHESLHPGVNVTIQSHNVFLCFLVSCEGIFVSQVDEHSWKKIRANFDSAVKNIITLLEL